MTSSVRRPLIGLALGSGSARGWAHIGVLRALLEAGLKPDVVAGASVGAIVGAAYAAGDLGRFEQWVRALSARDVWSFMDFGLSGGVLKGERLVQFFRTHFDDRPVQELPLRFGAVATALRSGDEVWLREGSVAEVVRASFALPGLFAPVWHEDRLLADGGLVNPVPVSLARAMGAEIVIAVDLNADIMGKHLRAPEVSPRGGWWQSLQQGIGGLLPARTETGEAADDLPTPHAVPSMLDVLTSSINVMQVRITRSRMAGDPPEATITPQLSHLGMLDFHRADEAIEAGRLAAAEVLPLLRQRGLIARAAPEAGVDATASPP